MRSRLSRDSAEEALLERMRTLYAQLKNHQCHRPRYERLSAEIHELSVAYDKLIEAKQRIDRPDPSVKHVGGDARALKVHRCRRHYQKRQLTR